MNFMHIQPCKSYPDEEIKHFNILESLLGGGGTHH